MAFIKFNDIYCGLSTGGSGSENYRIWDMPESWWIWNNSDFKIITPQEFSLYLLDKKREEPFFHHTLQNWPSIDEIIKNINLILNLHGQTSITTKIKKRTYNDR